MFLNRVRGGPFISGNCIIIIRDMAGKGFHVIYQPLENASRIQMYQINIFQTMHCVLCLQKHTSILGQCLSQKLNIPPTNSPRIPAHTCHDPHQLQEKNNYKQIFNPQGFNRERYSNPTLFASLQICISRNMYQFI